MIGLIIDCVDRAVRKLGKSDQAFQMAFLFTAGTSTKKIPAIEMANPTIEVIIRAPTLAVRCNPKSTNSQPPSTTATPISFMTAGCGPPPVLPSRGLILKNPQRDANEHRADYKRHLGRARIGECDSGANCRQPHHEKREILAL